uniref:Uncharacterized protein n=1 Tax=Parascaris equorum TaxID=6256 RepID=A0A914R880_PAREQ
MEDSQPSRGRTYVKFAKQLKEAARLVESSTYITEPWKESILKEVLRPASKRSSIAKQRNQRPFRRKKLDCR